MLYTINSDTRKNHNNGMCASANCYDIEAMSAVDAVIKASKNAKDDEEVICVDSEEVLVYAYRTDDGSYDFHIYEDDGSDVAFFI